MNKKPVKVDLNGFERLFLLIL